MKQEIRFNLNKDFRKSQPTKTQKEKDSCLDVSQTFNLILMKKCVFLPGMNNIDVAK